MHYRLSFNGPIQEVPTNALRSRVAQIFELPDCESLTVLFASEGGNTDQALSLYNFIRELPREIRFHAVGHVGSAAIPVYLAAHRRTCAPFSRFFFHVYDWTFAGPQTTDRIKEAADRLSSDIKLARAIAEKHTRIPAVQLDELYRDAPIPTIFKPEDAVAIGITDAVCMINERSRAEPNVAMWTVDW
jgi:ATP-dependent protease ClpP protease subunit